MWQAHQIRRQGPLRRQVVILTDPTRRGAPHRDGVGGQGEAPGRKETDTDEGDSVSKGLSRGFCRKKWAWHGKQA